MGVEVLGGVISNSLAILSDAAHMLSDILGIAISLVSVCIAKQPPTRTKTYGYHRAEVVGALISVISIWFLTIWLANEAFYRLWNPSPVNG